MPALWDCELVEGNRGPVVVQVDALESEPRLVGGLKDAADESLRMEPELEAVAVVQVTQDLETLKMSGAFGSLGCPGLTA